MPGRRPIDAPSYRSLRTPPASVVAVEELGELPDAFRIIRVLVSGAAGLKPRTKARSAHHDVQRVLGHIDADVFVRLGAAYSSLSF